MNKPPITLNQTRRASRAKDEAWIKAFLKKVPYGTLATEYDGQPYVKPTSFAYAEAENAIYIHGALKGHMRTDLEANPRVSFCIAEMGRLLPADTAMEVGVEYASVIIFGRAQVLTDPQQARHGLQLMLDRYFPQYKPGVDYREIQKEEQEITAVYKITIESWSGKEEYARPDFPGAFNFKAE
jgi:nitroimidazol reductase NimA-like FMN-containing flavoprotein (pyridoxamine 5'-phosphate oxidase superfamily)